MDDSSGQGRLERWLARALPYAPVAIATFWLARATSRGILARAGEPAVPLDDAYIHFQYARSLAEGRFYAFLPGDGYTSGATSLLWPALLAPFYAVGFRDTAIVWAAWLLGWVFLGLLAIETRRLAMGLLDDLSATGAAAAVIAFGGYTWFAASGMEVSLLAWLLALAARLSAEWAEKRDARSSRDLAWMVGVAVIAPLSRPEGMVASLLIALTLAVFPGERVQRAPSRLFALAALFGPLVPPLVNKAFTGHFSTTTTQVKWLVGNPYYGGPHLWAMVRANLDTFFRVLLDGREWSAIFIPPGSFPVAIAAVISVPVVGFRTRRSWRTLMVLALIAGMLLPTTYLSFLWNRLRYLWPFAFAWCIGLACLGRAVADVLSLIRPRFVRVAPILVGIGAGMLGHHLSWSMDDVANSAYAIHNQQVKLGRWAQANLPSGVRIGVNDTGAIAYFSGHRVFDVVGLTTPGEAPYWVAGAGSRFEHYERLHRATPSVLPTHFIVYPHWMACEPVLGRELTRATVTDQSILGGTTMIAYEARWDLLHTGDKPMDPPRGLLLDELDVSDLESEREHAYDLAAGGGTDNENRVRVRELEDRTLVDGGREHRVRDPFVLSFPTGKPAILVARWSSEHGATLDVRVAGAVVDTVAIPPTSWIERRVALPVGASGKVDVEVATRDGLFGSMHYWLYDASAPLHRKLSGNLRPPSSGRKSSCGAEIVRSHVTNARASSTYRGTLRIGRCRTGQGGRAMRMSSRAVIVGMAALSLSVVPRAADACGGAMWDEAAHRRPAPDLVVQHVQPRKRATPRPPEAVAADLLRAQEQLDEGNSTAAIRLVRAALPDVEEYDARWAKPHVARAMRTMALAILRSPVSDGARRDFALTTLEKLVQRDTEDPIARTDLGEALVTIPDRAGEGRSILEALAAEDLVVHANGYAALARGRLAKGDHAGARAAVDRCVQMAITSVPCRIDVPGAPAS